jgi:probable F420-dependent oxidoreductase
MIVFERAVMTPVDQQARAAVNTGMQIGVIFPQTEIGGDLRLLRNYVQGVEAFGYSHILLYDHVLGADPERPGGWSGPYSSADAFHEPLVFLAWVAAHTERVGLVTGVLVLPQRQTALVAKQAAEVDLLSDGRLRLGLGIGWNRVEYEALGEDFHTRGRKSEAQIELLRRLWAHPVVDVHDGFHTISRAGINPRPARQIPIWLGGVSERVLRRAARLADGWFPQTGPDDTTRAAIARLHGYLRAEGRDPAAFGVEGRMGVGRPDVDRQIERARRWRDLGVQYMAVNTMGAGLAPDQHVEALRRFKQAWDTADRNG